MNHDDYRELAEHCGVPITRERIAFHLRCLSVDSEWQASEVEEYIKQLERDRDVLAAEVMAWRRAFDEQTGKQIGDSSDCRDVSAARLTADESGALTRAR
jgi:hypothetical protein